jgi:hypothetical protein
MRRTLVLIALLALGNVTTARAQANPLAHLDVAFAPYKLGKSTNVELNLHIHGASSQPPPALTSIEIRYPRALGFDTSELGIRTCDQTRLEALGPGGCSAESHMGEGSATAELQVGTDIIHESAEIIILRAPESAGHIAMYFYVDAYTPVAKELLLPGQLLEATPPDEQIQIAVPLIPSFPDGPDVAITDLTAHFGPQGLTYYEHTHNHVIAYKPEGILLPHRCPRDGFTFSATLTFADDTNIVTTSKVACPSRIHD